MTIACSLTKFNKRTHTLVVGRIALREIPAAVMESAGNAQVCAIIEGASLEKDVLGSLSTSEISATGQ